MPAIPATGINTAINTNVVAITGAVTLAIASSVASLLFIPLAMFTCTASTTTIASSTTIPIANTRPKRDSTLIVNPSMGKNIKAPTNETGIARVGISVARQSWIKIKTTRITRIKAMIKVTTISLMPAVIGAVESSETSYLILSGKSFASTSISAIAISASSTALEPGAW